MDIAELKHMCHEVFDAYWISQLKCYNKKHMRKVRKRAYHKLAQEMHKSVRDSHFHYMNDIIDLQKAYNIILSWY